MEDIFDQIKNIIATNPFFQGGFLIAIMTGILVYARQVPARIYRVWDRYTTINLDLDDGSDQFYWLAQYCESIFEDSNFGDFFTVTHPVNRIVPAGSRCKRYGLSVSRFVLSKRELESKASSNNAVSYNINLKVYGVNKLRTLKKILSTCEERYGPKGTLHIMESEYAGWRQCSLLKDRNLDTIYCDQLDDILSDVKDFIGSKDKYIEKGIPYRRGYLFHGLPGTGKTSIAMAIARETERNLRIVNLGTTSGRELKGLLAIDKTLVLFEDIDVATNMVKERDSNDKDEVCYDTGANLSEILNAIDGATTGDNIIFIFTTNDISCLDKALLRPGRIDKRIYFSYATQSEFNAMCMRYYGKTNSKVVKEDLVHAEIQNFFLMNQDDYVAFLEETTK